jgi:hypothetical protein
MAWIFDVPLVIIGPLIIVLLVGIGLGGLLLVRRLLLPRLEVSEVDSEFTGAMVQGILVFYGLALALLAVNVLESYSDVSEIVSKEATSIAAFHRDVSAYPEPVRSDLREALRTYVESLINEAWPLQAQGKIPTKGVEQMTQIQKSLMSFQPQGAAQEIIHAETVAAYNRFTEARRMRLDTVTTGLPGIMWVVIIFGALISLISTFFFRVAEVRLHAILVGLLAAFIGIVIFMILALDRPFRGDLGISAAPYQLIYDQTMKQ